jgi:hypothetical protein
VTFVQYPYAVLVSLGTDLQNVSTKLGEKEHGAADVNGLGSDDQGRIQDAISSFRDEWKTSFRKLNEDIDNWGGLSKAIGDMVAQFDSQVGQALTPQGGP